MPLSNSRLSYSHHSPWDSLEMYRCPFLPCLQCYFLAELMFALSPNRCYPIRSPFVLAWTSGVRSFFISTLEEPRAYMGSYIFSTPSFSDDCIWTTWLPHHFDDYFSDLFFCSRALGLSLYLGLLYDTHASSFVRFSHFPVFGFHSVQDIALFVRPPSVSRGCLSLHHSLPQLHPLKASRPHEYAA